MIFQKKSKKLYNIYFIVVYYKMNIGNFKSVADKEAKQKLQAEYLQLLIDNQAELEKRVKNYQNPNVAPPVPPQYKTASELEKDSQKQEKDVIDNVLALSPTLTFSDASTVAEDLRSRGLDALVKFNRNFPAIKKRLLEEVNPKLLNAQVIIAKIDDVFGRIDATFGLNAAGYKAENYFGKSPKDILDVYPTSDLIRDMIGSIIIIVESELINVSPPQVAALEQIGAELTPILREMLDYLPSETQLNFIAHFKPLDRDDLSKILQQTLVEKVVPSKSVLEELYESLRVVVSIVELGEAADLGDSLFFDNADSVTQSRPPPPEDVDIDLHLQNIVESTATNPSFQSRAFTGAAGGRRDVLQPTQGVYLDKKMLPNADTVDKTIKLFALLLNNVSGFGQRSMFLLSKFKQKYDKINSEINNITLNPTGILDELDEEEKENIKNKSYIPIGELGQIASLRQRNKLERRHQEIYENQSAKEIQRVFRGKSQREKLKRQSSAAESIQKAFRAKQGRNQEVEDEAVQNLYEKVERLSDKQINHQLDEENENPIAPPFDRRLTRRDLATMSRDEKNEELVTRIFYDKQRDIRNRTYDAKSKGITRIFKSKEGNVGLGFTSNDEPRERTTLDRISHVPNTQQESSFAPNNSEMRRIKVGAGVSVKQDQPRYREFGKYRIHIPLLNDNVVNIKYPSLAGIPSIKPVEVSNQYADFIRELLDTGDFSHKKYNTLNEREQDHFAKISKASGLAHQFGIKPKSEDEDEEDYKRLMILKGEYEAGNDNEKLIKELRAKIVKFINNGRINRKQGLQYLMQLSV